MGYIWGQDLLNALIRPLGLFKDMLHPSEDHECILQMLVATHVLHTSLYIYFFTANTCTTTQKVR